MNKNRLLCLLLAIMMMLTIAVPTGVIAEDATEDSYVTEQAAEEEAARIAAEMAAAEEAARIAAEQAAAEEAARIAAEQAAAEEAARITAEQAAAEEADLLAEEQAVEEESAETTEEPELEEVPEVVEVVPEEIFVEEDPAAEELEAVEEVEEVEVPFEQGYVRVKNGTPMYETESLESDFGFFDEEQIVYAVVTTRYENMDDSWLWIVFDTEDSKANEGDVFFAYVQFKDVTVLDESEVTLLLEKLNDDITTRSFDNVLLTTATYVLNQVALPEPEVVTEEEEGVFAAGTITITEQPVAIVGAVGETVTLKVVATGSGLTYQWQYKKPGASSFTNASSAGAKTAEWKFNLVASADGREYRCVVTDGSGNSVTSDAVTVTIVSGELAITEQPVDIVGAVVDPVTLKVVATGSGLTYQWQYKKPGASSFTNASSAGAKTAEWKFNLVASADGREYRCVVTDGSGNSVTSDAVTVTIVSSELAITEQPVDIVGAVGDPVTLKVVATGSGLTYQWQYKKPGASSFANASSAGAKTAEWKFNLVASADGREYRCVVTDGSGNSVTSDAVTVTIVSSELAITEQPVDIVGAVGDPVTLKVVATGSGLTYQWQYKKPGASSFTSASSAGAKTAEWKFNLVASADGREYRCVVTDGSGNSVTSDVVTVTIVSGELAITEQPVDIVGAVGDSATLKVVATGSGLTYQWQYKKPGASSFTSATSADAKKAEWIFNLVTSLNGREYRCIVTDASGNSVTSDAVTVTIGTVEPLAITEQPEAITGMAGDTVSLKVVATGSGLTYQWQYKKPGASSFISASSAGAKTAEWTFDLVASLNGREYRCIVKDNSGNSVTSDAVLVTIISDIVIDDVTYAPLTADTCKIVSYSGSASSLVIPEVVQSMTVVEVGEEAFMGNTSLVSIDLPDTITVIRARAFKNCSNLSEMK